MGLGADCCSVPGSVMVSVCQAPCVARRFRPERDPTIRSASAGPVEPIGVRNEYAAHPDGVDGWYRDSGATYRNPHEAAVAAMMQVAVSRWPDPFTSRVLDLCCGSGEVSLALLKAGISAERIDGADPYTGAAYEARVATPCLPLSFVDVAGGALADRSYGAVVCSYALHLCEASWLPLACREIAVVSPTLIVVTPHKRPELRNEWGFTLVDEHRDSRWRTRLRRYERSP